MRRQLRFRSGSLVLVMAAVLSCRAQPREYAVRGQVMAVAPDRQQITLKHEDIPGFMPAMTMPYNVKDAALGTLTPGDLVTARLILAESEMPYLIDLKRTGHADVDKAAGPLMDPMVIHDVVPDDVLQDQDGAPRRLSDWNHQALAVTFVYTRCPMPDYCPLMDRKFAELQRAILADPALAGSTHLVSISFDPAHDTPAVLKAHAAKVGADARIWSFVTATSEGMAHVTSRFAVSATRDTDPAILVHNLRTAVIDRDGRLATVYNGSDWTTETLLTDLRNAVRR